MTKTFNDKDIRDEIVNYVTHQFSHTYLKTKFMRALLKSQNLTIDEMIVPLSSETNPSLPPKAEPEIFSNIGESLSKILSKHTQKITQKINPIPENPDLLRLEYIANNKHLLTEIQRIEFTHDAFRSKTENWATDFPGNLNSIKRDKISRWERRIQRVISP